MQLIISPSLPTISALAILRPRKRSAAIYDSLQNLLLFPNVGRQQTTEGVRKLVTRNYSYLIYYSVDQGAEEIVVLSVKHSARERDHSNV